MPDNHLTFTKAVLVALRELAKPPTEELPPEQWEYRLSSMAKMCLGFVQLEEALGSAPRRQEFTSLNNEYYWPVLADSVEDAVQIYGRAIQQAKRSLTGRE